jgi:hypothetical protein
MKSKLINTYKEKSIKLANEGSYLDKLQSVYPVEDGAREKLTTRVKNSIISSYYNEDKIRLIKILLDEVDKFPINDPYVSYLRKDRTFLEKNPKTVERIGNRLLNMEPYEIFSEITKEKEANRKLGYSFQNYLNTLPFNFVDSKTFLKYDDRILLLAGSNNELLNFVNDKLYIGMNESPNLVAKVGSKIVIGKSKFLSDYGGHQNNQLNKIISFFNFATSNSVVLIGLVDGIAWIKRNRKIHKKIVKSNNFIFSSLLLQDFFIDILFNDIKEDIDKFPYLKE